MPSTLLHHNPVSYSSNVYKVIGKLLVKLFLVSDSIHNKAIQPGTCNCCQAQYYIQAHVGQPNQHRLLDMANQP